MTQRQDTFIETFEPIRERLWRFVRAMVYKYERGDNETARDIMSETVLQTLERFDEIHDKQALLSFCFTVASRLYKQQFVRKKFWGLYQEELVSEISSTTTPPDVSADVRLLYEALQQLPLKTKEAVILFELSDVSLQEIQKIQGGSLSGVKSRVTRGREMLANILGVHSREPSDEEEHPGEHYSPETPIQYLQYEHNTR
ncbi:MAG: sigma-70 family RNA polymerase sigma factor [Bacteriodetes bacterium]|nr:sigma-70 family RNA polymerase sigma factor [Bacteroidota bacterium]